MNAFNKFKTSVAQGYDAKKKEANDKIAELKEKRNKQISDSVSDVASAKSGNRTSNPYQEGKVTFSLESMEDFTHEELQTVVKRYDNKYKEARGIIKEQTDKVE